MTEDDTTQAELAETKPRRALNDRVLDLVAGLGVGGALVAAGIALVADLPEAATALGSVAVTVAMFAAVAPMLAAAMQRMDDEDPAARDWPRVWWLFGLGAVLAAVRGADAGRVGDAAAAILLAGLASRLAACASAMPGQVRAFAAGSVARMGAVVLAGLACVGAAASVGAAAGFPKLDPVAEGAMDGAALALAFYGVLLALSPGPQVEEDKIVLLPRWGGLYTMHNAGAAAVAVVQVWLWRFHGASPTGLLVLACGAAIAAVALLLSGMLHQRGRPAAKARAWAAGLVGLLLAAEVCFVISAATYSLQGAGRVLASVDLPIWPWGWRLPLLMVAMIALQAAGRRRGEGATGLGAQAGAVAALLVGQYLWVQQASLAGPMIALSGLGAIAAHVVGHGRGEKHGGG